METNCVHAVQECGRGTLNYLCNILLFFLAAKIVNTLLFPQRLCEVVGLRMPGPRLPSEGGIDPKSAQA